LFLTAKLSTLTKILIPAMLLVLALNFTMPKYVGYVSRVGLDAFSLAITGKDTRGIGNYRVSGTGDLLIAKKYIKNNLWLGTGYTYLYWGDVGYATSPRGDTFARAADAAEEVPIYYVFFGFGIIGALLITPLYVMIAKLFFRAMKLFRKNILFLAEEPLSIVFMLYVLLIIVTKFTINFYTLGQDFRAGYFGTAAVWLGLGFSLLRIFSMKNEKEVLEINSFRS